MPDLTAEVNRFKIIFHLFLSGRAETNSKIKHFSLNNNLHVISQMLSLIHASTKY